MTDTLRIVLKSKIHRATVTHADLHYDGSLGVDARLLRLADIVPYEQVHVLSIASGARFETYAIEEPEDSGRVAVYGAAARLVAPGDLVIVMSYRVVPDLGAGGCEPRIVLVDSSNRPVLKDKP